MITPKPRLRWTMTPAGWAWVQVSGDGLNDLGGGDHGPVEASPLEAFPSQDLPASVDAGAGLLGIPDFFRRTDGLTVAQLVERAAARASA
jgi:hypothetical protein